MRRIVQEGKIVFPAILVSLKRPVLLTITSAFFLVAIILLWLKFPDFVPLGILLFVGIAGALTLIVSQIITVLRIAQMAKPYGQFEIAIRNLPARAFLSLLIVLVICNAALLYFYHPRPSIGFMLVVNLAAVLSWFVGQLAMQRRTHK